MLTDKEIESALLRHPDWRVIDQAFCRTIECPSFMDAVGLLTRIAEVAERIDHHPDLLLSYRRLSLTVQTHDAGGLTDQDLLLLDALEPLL